MRRSPLKPDRPQTPTQQRFHPHFPPHSFQRPTHRRISAEKHRIVAYRFATNAFHLRLAFATEEIKPNAIAIRLNQLRQARSQFSILRRRQIALEHAKLHPLSVRLENLVNLGAAFVLGNIVTDHNKHRSIPLTSSPTADTFQSRPSSISPKIAPGFQTPLDKYNCA